MSKNRCSQCDKELPPSWSHGANANWDAVCPECAARDLKKKSLRRRRILDTSVRKKTGLEMLPQSATAQQQSGQATAQAQAPVQPNSAAVPPARPAVQSTAESSRRVPIPMDFELDTEDPMLLGTQQESKDTETKIPDSLEETTQIRKPKLPPGPQVRLNF